jgi:N6-L-threonylcarbamoyladenine synthase/protein kinase Bud32
MHTAYAMLLEVAERGISYTKKKEIMVIGGVAASKALSEMLIKFCEQRGVKLYIPPIEVCLDNGVMIGDLGLKMFISSGPQKLEDTEINPLFRTDMVNITW